MRTDLPPVWLMGLSNLTFGIFGAIMLITVPQLLAARGVPEPDIAGVTALALVPSFLNIVLAPILDVRFSRRTYAVAMGLLTAALTFAAILSIADLAALRVLLFAACFASFMFQNALGGWLGGLVDRETESQLGAWFTLANIGGFGVTAIVAITLLRALPPVVGPAAIAGLMVCPMLLFLRLPAPGPDRQLARESFAGFFAALVGLVKRPTVQRAMLLFVLPGATFALTNMLGGIGSVFGASERLVGLIAGAGVTLAGVVGTLAIPRLARRVALQPLYLGIGATGALFTLALLLLPRTPATFAVALIGENIFQAAAFTTMVTIAFNEVGRDNPLAASEFAIITAAQGVPLAYMQWIDGRAYAAHGVGGSFTVDAGLGLLACAGLALLLRRWRVPAAVAV